MMRFFADCRLSASILPTEKRAKARFLRVLTRNSVGNCRSICQLADWDLASISKAFRQSAVGNSPLPPTEGC